MKTKGRPPIGDRARTNAERAALHRLTHFTIHFDAIDFRRLSDRELDKIEATLQKALDIYGEAFNVAIQNDPHRPAAQPYISRVYGEADGLRKTLRLIKRETVRRIAEKLTPKSVT